MQDTTNDVIYFVVRYFRNREAFAIGTCPLRGEVKLDFGHIIRSISKAEYDSYIALDLFPQYESTNPSFIWRDLYGEHGSYFGVTMVEEEGEIKQVVTGYGFDEF